MMSDNPNQDICDILIKIGEHERDVSGIIYKYHAYRKAAKALEQYGKRVESGAEAQKLSGIGPKIAQKIDEFLATGDISLNKSETDESSKNEKAAKTIDSPRKRPSNAKDKVKNNKLKKENESKKDSKPKTPAKSFEHNDEIILNNYETLMLTKIDAINLKINGVEKIGDLRNDTDIFLNESQKLCLEHFDDLFKKIPINEIRSFEKILDGSVKKMTEISFEICGDYRRRLTESNQIDVLLVDMLAKSDSNDFKEHCRKIKKLLIKTLSSDGLEIKKIAKETSYNQIQCLIKIAKRYRRVNFYIASRDQRICLLFHLTGSIEFVEKIQNISLKNGFLLSLHSLRRIGQTLVAGLPIHLKNEKELFEYIGHPYVEPENR